MIAKALSSDLLKIRRKGLWLLAIVAPVGLLAMQALNIGLRYDYFVSQYGRDLWNPLISSIVMFVPVSLFLGSTLVSSLLANIEHDMSSWKQLLALPVSRYAVFSAKFLVAVILLAFSCALLSAGTALFGLCFGFDMALMPVGKLLRLSFFPFLASLPALALMLWLCLTFRNQSLSITLGVVLSIGSLFTLSLSEWFPTNWPLAAYEGAQPGLFLGMGAVTGLIILALGMLHFGRRDVA